MEANTDPIRKATQDEPLPGQRAWLMTATMANGTTKRATHDLLNGHIRSAVFVSAALHALGPADVVDYTLWIVM